MTMSNVNNKLKAKQQPRAKKQQAMSKRQNEEIGAEFSFDSKHFNKEGEFSTKKQPVSERTAWN